jgi:AcrR family transcriptional regulator
MQNPRGNSNSCETRRRLLEAAGEVFAAQGFHSATIRQICERAGANVAAVNYHFRDKGELYDAVLQYSHCAAEAAYAAHQPSPEAVPEERLRWYVRSMMFRLLDEGRPAWHGKLMAQEMSEPTAALDRLVKNVFLPRLHFLAEIVRELLGEAATEPLIEVCCNSINAQCVFYHHCKPLMQRMQPEVKFDHCGIEALVDHVTRFSLMAIRGMAGAADATPIAVRS